MCCSPWGHKELDMTEWLNKSTEMLKKKNRKKEKENHKNVNYFIFFSKWKYELNIPHLCDICIQHISLIYYYICSWSINFGKDYLAKVVLLALDSCLYNYIIAEIFFLWVFLMEKYTKAIFRDISSQISALLKLCFFIFKYFSLDYFASKFLL